MDQSKFISCGACEKKISIQALACPGCGHPNEYAASGWFSKGKWLVTTLLAIIGLSGFADGFVEWREFFEVGFMENYRAFKMYILSWIPIDVWWWVPDYCVLGGVSLLARQRAYLRFGGMFLEQDKDHKNGGAYIKIADQHPIVFSVIRYILNILIWPLLIFGSTVAAVLEGMDTTEEIEDEFFKRLGNMYKTLIQVLAFSIIALFVFVDFANIFS